MYHYHHENMTYSFLHLDRVNVYSRLRVREVVIEAKDIGVIHFLSNRPFLQDFLVRTCQGLQCPAKFTVLYRIM